MQQTHHKALEEIREKYKTIQLAEEEAKKKEDEEKSLAEEEEEEKKFSERVGKAFSEHAKGLEERMCSMEESMNKIAETVTLMEKNSKK